MPAYSRLQEVDRIDMADRGLRALAADGEMLARMGTRGYKEARLDAGRALVEAARGGRRTQDAESGEKLGATDDAVDAWVAAKKPYFKEVRFAKQALRGDRDALEDLGLLDPRRRSRVAAMDQAHNFYASALARKDARLDGVGLDEAALAAGLARVEAVAATRGRQQAEREDAKTATRKKSEAVGDLDTWMAPFLETARAEFAEEPERLAILGLVR